MIDTLRVAETPEGVFLQMRAAGALPRACAWALDFLIRCAALFTLAGMFAMLGTSGTGLYLLALFVVFWIYPIAFEVLFDGQTPGKMIMKLRVVTANGTPVSWIASIVRNLLRAVDMLPIAYGFGLTASLIDPHGRRLGDLVAGTLVVYADVAAPANALPNVPALPSPIPLPMAERAAIIEFSERSARLTPERQEELADLLPALTDARQANAVRRLHGLAASFLGRT